MTPERWQTWQRWRGGHAAVFCALAVVSATGAQAINAAPISAQLLVLTVLTLVIGLPHGGLDLPVARRWLYPAWGARWFLLFLAGYTLVAGTVVAGWAFAPSLTLGFFLLTGAAHFGISDTDFGGLDGWRRWLEGMARGAAPIAMAAWTWPGEVRTLFIPLAGEAGATMWASAWGAVAPGAMVLLGLAALLRLRDGVVRNSRNCWLTAAELVAVALVFYTLRPLAAFTLYWIGLHSLRVLVLAATERPGSLAQSLPLVTGQGMPATAGAMLLAAAAYGLFFHNTDVTQASLAILFMGLAALNTPHMIFVALSARHR